MIQFLKKIWKDPVWSTVISAGVLAIITLISLQVKTCFNDKSFFNELKVLFNKSISLQDILLLSMIIFVIYKGFGWLFRNAQLGYSDTQKATDKQLFDNIRNEVLPSEGGIDFIRNYDFGGAFLNKQLFDLHYYLSKVGKPEFEFINVKLNNILFGLHVSISLFLTTVALKTFSVNNQFTDANSVPKEWQTDNPERFQKSVDEIHKYAEEVCRNYDQLIQSGRRIFGE